MKITITCVFVAVSALWGQEGAFQSPKSAFQTVCTNATLEGNYGFTVSGMRPSSPGGPLEVIVGVAMTHFDGNGNLTQNDNIHGSITGFPGPDRKGTGTYTINSDCSGTMKITSEGGPTLTLRIVVVDNGNEVRTAVVDPTASVPAGSAAPQVMVISNGRRVATRSAVSRGNFLMNSSGADRPQ